VREGLSGCQEIDHLDRFVPQVTGSQVGGGGWAGEEVSRGVGPTSAVGQRESTAFETRAEMLELLVSYKQCIMYLYS